MTQFLNVVLAFFVRFIYSEIGRRPASFLLLCSQGVFFDLKPIVELILKREVDENGNEKSAYTGPC
jgi:hypothetical protein